MWTIVFAGLVIMGLSIPLAARKIGPNRFYGFRTPRVMADDRVWFPVNQMTGRNGIVFALMLWFGAALSAFGMVSILTVGMAILPVLVLGLISTFVSAARIVNQIDAGGARIDYRSSFEKSRSHDAKKARKKLFEKL